MQASVTFEKIIQSHLESVAENDALFAETLKKPKKNIKECVNYIMSTVKQSGKNALADEEVFAMAVHYYDEDSIKDVKPTGGKVVVTTSKSGVKPKPTQKVNKKSASPVAQNSLF